MVSVALLDKSGSPIPRDAWTARALKVARRAARIALDKVGDPETDVAERGTWTLIVRRCCRDHERRHVVEKYLRLG